MKANFERSALELARPPRIVPALTAGFNTVASNIHLIIIPVVLDLLLWFGPHLRLKTLLEPTLISLLAFTRRSASPEMASMVDNMETLWTAFLGRFNLISQLSTFPLGVPSLIAGSAPLDNPLGAAADVQAQALWQAALGWLGLTLLGYLLGALYLAFIARSCGKQAPCESGALPGVIPAGQPGSDPAGQPGSDPAGQPNGDPAGQAGQAPGKVPPLQPGKLAWQAAQLVLLVIILFIALMILLVPAVLVSSFLALINPIVAQLALVLMSFSLVWFLVPLIFSPHGIFLCGHGVLNAMLSSTRVVRFSLSTTGLFLLVLVVLYQGMSVLWRIPPEQSWMTLVGIAGHAFISTGLLAATFYYYRSGLEYIQALRKLSAKNA